MQKPLIEKKKKKHSATYMYSMNYGYGLKNKGSSWCFASLLWYWQNVPQSNATVHKTVIISLATASAIETTQ